VPVELTAREEVSERVRLDVGGAEVAEALSWTTADRSAV
jgi:hypothetical protein